MSEPISKAHMKGVDRLWWDPAERASGILAMINNLREQLKKDNVKNKRHPTDGIPTDWDLLCFAIEYTGAQALAIQDPEFLSLAVAIERWLYSTHYSNPSKIYGPPDKKEDKLREAIQSEGRKQTSKVRPSVEPRGDDTGAGDHEEPSAPEGAGGADRAGDHDGSRDN